VLAAWNRVGNSLSYIDALPVDTYTMDSAIPKPKPTSEPRVKRDLSLSSLRYMMG
jgi:hypothetical protein